MPVDALTAGTGIGIGGSTGVPSIFNTGLVSIANSNLTGLSNIGTSSNVALSNLGVISLTGSSNVIVSQPKGNVNVFYQSPPVGVVAYLTNIPPNPQYSANPQTVPYDQYGKLFENGVSFAGLGINPASFDFIEVSTTVMVQVYEPFLENGFSFIFYADDSPNIGAVNYYGDQQYWLVNDNAFRLHPCYIRYTMRKGNNDYTNASTAFNLYFDSRWSPFPNGIRIYTNFLSIQVRAFNSVS